MRSTGFCACSTDFVAVVVETSAQNCIVDLQLKNWHSNRQAYHLENSFNDDV